MLTSEIKVNGQVIETIRVRNDSTGVNGYPLEGVANYDVHRVTMLVGPYETKNGRTKVARIENWDRSRPAHELIDAARKACQP